jgi:hypothetical protein
MASESPSDVDGITRVCQILVAALCLGIVSFGVVAIQQGLAGEPDDARLFTLIACGTSVAAILGAMILPRMIVATHRRQLARNAGPLTSNETSESSERAQLAAIYQTKTIIGAALFEGAAFMSLFAFLAESQPIALAAAAVMLVGVISCFPTRGRIANWLDHQFRLLTEERQLL